MKKEYKAIGWTKCSVCGKTVRVLEAENARATPWFYCPHCQSRVFLNGVEGQALRKALLEGREYSAAGGQKFRSLAAEPAAPAPAPKKNEEEKEDWF